MQLSIVTINYNSSENTIKLLNSLNDQTDSDFTVLVIDNASEKADFKNLEKEINKGILLNKIPLLIRNEENFGFSSGNNVGIKKALETGAEWVLLLNNDTWVESDFVGFLKAELSHLSGIAGVPLMESDRTAYYGRIEWLKPTLSHNYVKHPVSNIYAIGGGMAVSREVFDKIGFLDEKYFLYFEDADFSIRARKAGILISITQGFMIYHKASSTTKKLGSPLLLRYHYRNALYFNLKNGPWYIKLLVWPWSWFIILKQILKIMIYHNREESVAILKGVLDFYKNKMSKINL